MSGLDTVARALELARNGQVRTIGEIRRALTKEGCFGVHEHLSGKGLQKQLRDAIDARAAEKKG